MIRKILISIYILFILLYPCQLEILGITYAKILLVISSGLFVYQMILLRKKEKNFELINKLKNSILFYFLVGIFLFTVCVLISNIISIILGNKLYINNVFEILRGFLYIITIINCYIFIEETSDNKNIFQKLLLFSIVLTLIVSFIQYFNLFNINSLYIKQIAPTQYKTLLNNYPSPRIVGLTGNPNVFGCLLSIYLIFVLYKIIKNDKIINKNKSDLYYILFILLRIAIYMTGTRSAFIISIASELVLFIIMIIKNRQIKNLMIKFLIIIICEVLMLISLPNSMTWRVKHLMNLDNIKSWNVRIEHNQDIIDDIITNENKDNNLNSNIDGNEDNSNQIDDSKKESPKENSNTADNELASDNKIVRLLFGVGSNKENHNAKSGENEWLMLFYKYGILGIVSFLMIFVLQLFKIKKNSRLKNALFFAMFILVAIYMIPQGFYHVYNLMLAFILFYCYGMECD